MGSSDYSFSSRSLRTASYTKKDKDGNFEVTTDNLFEQNKKRESHKSMLPNLANKAHLRECRDSDNHPNSVPIIIALDVTGSMGHIPEHLIREGLPNMVSKLMEKGVKDPAILIMACGDSKCDNNDGVFQLGQFESGDVEMDMWLERIWISNGGGGNGGESYNWPYFYAMNHIETDAWDKRKQKGFIFTIGDDNCHPQLTSREISEVMGDIAKSGETVDTKSMVEQLKDKWNIYHLDLDTYDSSKWSSLLGKENVIKCGRTDYDGMANKIADIVAGYVTSVSPTQVAKEDKKEDKEDKKFHPHL